MNLLNKKNNQLLGIDISATGIKLVELSKENNRYHLERIGSVTLPEGAVVEKGITNKKEVISALKKLIKSTKTKNKNVCIAVPSSSIITKMIQLPKDLNSEEMEERIMIEADQYIPYSIEEVSIDFTIKGENTEDPEKNNVLLVASRQEGINDRIEVLTEAGLTPAVMDVETFAIENALHLIKDQIPNAGKNKVIALVDIGATNTTLTVIEDGVTIYTREQGGGSRQLTNDIEKRYGIPFEEAEIVKINGGLPDNYQPEVLTPFKNMIIQSISRSMQSFMSSSSNKRIDAIGLMGGGALITGLSKQAESMLGIDTFIVNPFINIHVPDKSKINMRDATEKAPSLFIAAGLALREEK